MRSVKFEEEMKESTRIDIMENFVKYEEEMKVSTRIDIMENLVHGDSECCIYRVPRSIRRLDEKAYTPRLISIGPLHHHNKDLEDINKEYHKIRFTESFRLRITKKKGEEFYAELRNNMINYIEKKEQRIRNCYAEPCKLQSRAFVKMILDDATFIFEFFLRCYYNERGDILLRVPVNFRDIFIDLELLENQLPFFVLEELYTLAFTSPTDPTFNELCCHFFSDYISDSRPDQVGVQHFTDLRRSSLMNGHKIKSELTGNIYIPCAVKLHKSGIKFKGVKRESIADIRFEKRHSIIPWFTVCELEIPHIIVTEGTECLLKNIRAFEQCHYSMEAVISRYVDLMDNLIHTEKDVDLLVEEGVIDNYLGDGAAVASMFNKLTLQNSIYGSHYNSICNDLNAHYNNPWNKTKATLTSVYFSNLWRGTGTIAAVILLLLTVAQTIGSLWDFF